MHIQQILNKGFSNLNTSLYDSVWPLHLVCRIIGLSNFKMDLHQSKYIVDKAMVVVSALQYLVLLIIIFYGWYYTNDFGTTLKEFRLKVAFVCYMVNQTILLCNVYVGLFFTNQIVWLLNQISQIDEDLKLLGVEIDHRYLN